MALADNLVSYWQMGSANDSHGTNHLTNNNSVSFTTGKVGNAASFAAASSQYLSHADDATVLLLPYRECQYDIKAIVDGVSTVLTQGTVSVVSTPTATV